MNIKTPFEVAKNAFNYFTSKDPFSYAGTIAFYTIFSLPAFFIIIMTISSFFLDDASVRIELKNQITYLINEESANEVMNILNNNQFADESWWKIAIGVGTLLFSATTVFGAIQNSFNIIWNITTRPGKNIIFMLVSRLTSLAIVFSLSFFFVVSLLLDAAINIFSGYLEQFLSSTVVHLAMVINFILSLTITTGIFTLLYRALPDLSLRLRDTWLSALITTLLFGLGKFLIGYYLSATQMGSAYGAASAFVIILVWIYYTSIILIFGCALTRAITEHRRGRVKTYPFAVRTKIEYLEDQKNG